MVISIQVLFVILMVVSFVGLIAEKEDKKLKKHLANVCIVAIIITGLTIFF